jgi:hypothetical protein
MSLKRRWGYYTAMSERELTRNWEREYIKAKKYSKILSVPEPDV